VTITANPELLVGFLLALVRASAWLVVVPPFGTRAIPSQVKVGFAAALALPMAKTVALHAPSLEVAPLIGAVAAQVAVGAAARLRRPPVLRRRAVGRRDDRPLRRLHRRPRLRPAGQRPVLDLGRFYNLLATTLLFAINGHILLVRGFLTSFEAVSATPTLHDLSSSLVANFATLFLAALEIAAPLMAALFLAEVALGLLSKAAPQMNVFIVGFPVKILLTLFLAGLALPLLPGTINSLLGSALRASSRAAGAFGG